MKPQYSNGEIRFSVTCDANKDLKAQTLPSDFVKNLIESDMFVAATYSGYQVATVKQEGQEDKDIISFQTSAVLVPNESAYHPDSNSKEEKKK